MEKPYVGIKGFTSRTEVESVLATAPQMPHAIMIGVFMNEEILAGKADSHPRHYPDTRHLGELFVSHQRALNLVCYQTAALDSLYDQLSELRERCGPSLHGFHLDLPELPIETLERIRREWPESKTVLRLNREMFRKSAHRPIVLADMVNTYSNLLDYAIADFTNGDCVPSSPDLLRSVLRCLKADGPDVRFGIGGGLGVYTLSPFKALFRENPDLCLDADFRLRDDEGRLDQAAVREFLNRSARLLGAD